MNRPDYLALKFSSYDTDLYIQQFGSVSENGYVLVYDFEQIVVSVAPHGRRVGWKLPMFSVSIGKLNHLIFPIQGLLNILVFMCYFGFFVLWTRPKVLWIEHTWSAFVGAVLRRLGVVDYCLYALGDWLVDGNRSLSPRSLANNILFKYLDFWAAKWSDRNLTFTEQIHDARKKIWGDKIDWENVSFGLSLTPMPQAYRKDRNCILFLGRVMSSSGLEWILDLLPDLYEKAGIKLKIIGPKTSHRIVIQQTVKRRKMEAMVEDLAYVDFNELYENIADCFCGTNLITRSSHSMYTIPGKLVHSLQAYMPLLVTDHAGPVCEIIKEHRLGIICNEPGEPLKDALLRLHQEQDEYFELIDQFQKGHQGQYIRELFPYEVLGNAN